VKLKPEDRAMVTAVPDVLEAAFARGATKAELVEMLDQAIAMARDKNDQTILAAMAALGALLSSAATTGWPSQEEAIAIVRGYRDSTTACLVYWLIKARALVTE
jgi:hypothetical protein